MGVSLKTSEICTQASTWLGVLVSKVLVFDNVPVGRYTVNKMPKRDSFTSVGQRLSFLSDSLVWADLFSRTTRILGQLTVKVYWCPFSSKLWVKTKHLDRRTIFCQSACLNVRQTVVSTTYVKFSGILSYRLNSIDRSSRGITNMTLIICMFIERVNIDICSIVYR
jgi:hypothetical protein